MIRAFSVILLMIAVLPAAQAGCWTTEDKKIQSEAELDGKAILLFKDAVTCQPVVDATVKLGDQTFQTDFRGSIAFASLDSVMDERLKIEVVRDGYIPLQDHVRVEAGVIVNPRYVMSKTLGGDAARFVLTWNAEPIDLDLHLVGNDFHVSFRDKKNHKNEVVLDTDSTEGWGPETITVKRINPGQSYRLYVHNFSNDQPYDKYVKVLVYANGRQERIIRVKPTVERTIQVLTMDHKGKLSYQNSIVQEMR